MNKTNGQYNYISDILNHHTSFKINNLPLWFLY